MGNVMSWLAQYFYPEDQVFWFAARYNDTNMIQLAALRMTPETRKYLEWQEPYTGRTPLLEAAAKGHCNCARLLIEAGANCNAKDLKMNTPLHLACKRAQLEMVKFLLQVPAVNPFEINLCMKTPLDLARSRFLEEEENMEARLYARCIHVLEEKTCLYSGWLYKKTDNVLSLVSGISSLNSWTRRFCMVLERGDPAVLELAFFRMKAGSGMRPVCPTSVMLYNVAAGMETISDPRWFSPKDFTFLLRGDQLSKCHYRASSAIQNLVHFAAIDQASFDAWKVFFIYQQQRLVGRCHPTVSRHDNRIGWNARPMVPAASLITLPPEEDNCRAIRHSLRTTPHTLDLTNAALSRPFLPVSAPDLEVSAPDWDDREECELIGNAAETKECCAELEPSFASEQTLPVVHGEETSVYSSTGECVICFNGPQSAVCVPCGHNAVCMKCAEEIQTSAAECPVCRAHIREFIKLYRV
ncbi:unnamed protein product [Peronospora farinosa]|uniref:RING-type domain-containing protein n=1 Tax=Peronospora farinosa TaxID=134698 RepID=A0AAV0UA53_9STRA|nr:unnamed protein product [Peronospora farinosa]CAI5733664.1 unnamed protein product [Peronospora farinosa]